jgi:hypothetical protein
MGFGYIRSICVVTVQVVNSVIAVQSASAQQAPKDSLAAQIRDQGYSCNKPVSAQKDSTRSKPDEAVWVLRCENSSYRLRLVPDMAARVERLK